IADSDRPHSPFTGKLDFSARTPVRVLPLDEIEQMLAAHRLYLESERRQGSRADFVPRECRRQTRFLFQDPLQRARPRRAGCRQVQALQTHRLTLREDRTELCRLHLACGHVYLGQIRPHGLTSPGARTGHSSIAYSITSSAWSRSDGAMVMPSVLAVFKLIASSNLFGFWTRKS